VYAWYAGRLSKNSVTIPLFILFCKTGHNGIIEEESIAPFYVRKDAVEEANIAAFALRTFNADMPFSAGLATYLYFPGLLRDT
jgi:hypothetical protein